jgi:hypothetical protein
MDARREGADGVAGMGNKAKPMRAIVMDALAATRPQNTGFDAPRRRHAETPSARFCFWIPSPKSFQKPGHAPDASNLHECFG